MSTERGAPVPSFDEVRRNVQRIHKKMIPDTPNVLKEAHRGSFLEFKILSSKVSEIHQRHARDAVRLFSIYLRGHFPSSDWQERSERSSAVEDRFALASVIALAELSKNKVLTATPADFAAWPLVRAWIKHLVKVYVLSENVGISENAQISPLILILEPMVKQSVISRLAKAILFFTDTGSHYYRPIEHDVELFKIVVDLWLHEDVYPKDAPEASKALQACGISLNLSGLRIKSEESDALDAKRKYEIMRERTMESADDFIAMLALRRFRHALSKKDHSEAHLEPYARIAGVTMISCKLSPKIRKEGLEAIPVVLKSMHKVLNQKTDTCSVALCESAFKFLQDVITAFSLEEPAGFEALITAMRYGLFAMIVKLLGTKEKSASCGQALETFLVNNVAKHLCFYSVITLIESDVEKNLKPEDMANIGSDRNNTKLLSDFLQVLKERFVMRKLYKVHAKICCAKCSNENKKCYKMKICSGCRTTLYCSRSCQILDWTERHSPECHESRRRMKEGTRCLSWRDAHFARHLAVWEVRRHEPGLRRLIGAKYHGQTYENVYFKVDLSSVPVHMSVRRMSSSLPPVDGPRLIELGEIPITFHISYGPFTSIFEYLSKVGTTDYLDPRVPPQMSFTGPFQKEKRWSGEALQELNLESAYDEIDDVMRWLNHTPAAKAGNGFGLHLAGVISSILKQIDEDGPKSKRWPFETSLSHLCDLKLT